MQTRLNRFNRTEYVMIRVRETMNIKDEVQKQVVTFDVIDQEDRRDLLKLV
jgi:hypothetical protein